MIDLATLKALNDKAARRERSTTETDFAAERRYREAAILGNIAPENFGRIEPFQAACQQ